MWLADGWKEYEVIDCSNGEKLERWGDYILVRPDPQVIWKGERRDPRWRQAHGVYRRVGGGGKWVFGVIYMDILMPNMNGLDATREIRALDRKDAKKVPIIAVSANTFSDDVFESRKAGMNKHLGKPLDEEKMIKAYKQCAVLSEEPIKLNGDL